MVEAIDLNNRKVELFCVAFLVKVERYRSLIAGGFKEFTVLKDFITGGFKES